MDPILALAQKHGLKIIEDSAEAIEQEYKGRPCGGFGDIGTLSFYRSKHVTTGEGEMVMVDDSKLALAGAMRRAKLAALRAAKALAFLKIQLQKQLALLAFKSTFGHFRARFGLQGHRKQCLRCHRIDSVPPSQGFSRQRGAYSLSTARSALLIHNHARSLIHDSGEPITGSK